MNTLNNTLDLHFFVSSMQGCSKSVTERLVHSVSLNGVTCTANSSMCRFTMDGDEFSWCLFLPRVTQILDNKINGLNVLYFLHLQLLVCVFTSEVDSSIAVNIWFLNDLLNQLRISFAIDACHNSVHVLWRHISCSVKVENWKHITWYSSASFTSS